TDGDGSHGSTSKTPSYTKSVSWHHYPAAIIKDAYIAITHDTSILHMASAYNTPVVAIYADYKTRWPAMADVSESVVVGQKIDNISLDEFAKALKSVLARI
ncbi:glycosyltransferase family 9 protein, partial [Escherichia coli]|uniref:glycosyltransferase family 9 protein n=1 Tax=Escherichia coli TaxID=562 RepID=UPI0024BFF12C